jgi:WD40 repeat protein
LKDGLRAVSVSEDEVKVWDVAPGKEVLPLENVGEFIPSNHQCATDPTGRWIALGSFTNFVSVYDAVTGKKVWESVRPGGAGLFLSRLCFTADGSRLVGEATREGIMIWDSATGRVQQLLKEKQSFFSDDLAVTPGDWRS